MFSISTESLSFSVSDETWKIESSEIVSSSLIISLSSIIFSVSWISSSITESSSSEVSISTLDSSVSSSISTEVSSICGSSGTTTVSESNASSVVLDRVGSVSFKTVCASSVKSALFIIFSNSSPDNAIVSSVSSESKKPPDEVVSSSGISISSETSGCGIVFSVERSDKSFFNELISFFKLDKSATICCKRLVSTTVEPSGTVGCWTTASSWTPSSSFLSLISFTIGAEDKFSSSPTDKS